MELLEQPLLVSSLVSAFEEARQLFMIMEKRKVGEMAGFNAQRLVHDLSPLLEELEKLSFLATDTLDRQDVVTLLTKIMTKGLVAIASRFTKVTYLDRKTRLLEITQMKAFLDKGDEERFDCLFALPHKFLSVNMMDLT